MTDYNALVRERCLLAAGAALGQATIATGDTSAWLGELLSAGADALPQVLAHQTRRAQRPDGASPPAAVALATAAREDAGSDYGLGLAGGRESRGRIAIAVTAPDGRTRVRELAIPGGPEEIRRLAPLFAAQTLTRAIMVAQPAPPDAGPGAVLRYATRAPAMQGRDHLVRAEGREQRIRTMLAGLATAGGEHAFRTTGWRGSAQRLHWGERGLIVAIWGDSLAVPEFAFLADRKRDLAEVTWLAKGIWTPRDLGGQALIPLASCAGMAYQSAKSLLQRGLLTLEDAVLAGVEDGNVQDLTADQRSLVTTALRSAVTTA